MGLLRMNDAPDGFYDTYAAGVEDAMVVSTLSTTAPHPVMKFPLVVFAKVGSERSGQLKSGNDMLDYRFQELSFIYTRTYSCAHLVDIALKWSVKAEPRVRPGRTGGGCACLHVCRIVADTATV